MVVSWIRRLPERVYHRTCENQPAAGGCEYRVSPSRAQARRLLSVLKVITRREGGGRLWKSRSDFQGAVGAFAASMAPAASTALVTWAPQWRGSASDSS